VPTTISNPGQVTSITFNTNPFVIQSIGDGGPNFPFAPVVISPSDADVTVVLVAPVTAGNGNYALSSDFSVGAVVEFCMLQNSTVAGQANLWDENGNDIGVSNGLGEGFRIRKLTTGSGRNWGRV
jgi:hypothetical protein